MKDGKSSEPVHPQARVEAYAEGTEENTKIDSGAQHEKALLWNETVAVYNLDRLKVQHNERCLLEPSHPHVVNRSRPVSASPSKKGWSPQQPVELAFGCGVKWIRSAPASDPTEARRQHHQLFQCPCVKGPSGCWPKTIRALNDYIHRHFTIWGMHGKLHFQCAKGHEWYSSPSNLTYRNTWCPTCGDWRGSQRRRLTAADMRYTARQFGGEFVSTEYKGANVKHEWRCHRGHHFWQTPNNVRRAEGGRRTASFCKDCNAIDRDVIKASVLAGYDPQEAKIAQVALERAGAMPLRRHFTPQRKRSTRAEVEKKPQRVTMAQATRALGTRSPFSAEDFSYSAVSSNAEGEPHYRAEADGS